MGSAHVRKGDMVVIASGVGASEGTKGRVVSVDLGKQRVIVENAKLVTKHMKKGRVRQSMTGARLKKEAPIAISNVALYCPKCDRGVRSAKKVDDQGRKRRVCRKCGEVLPQPQDK